MRRQSLKVQVHYPNPMHLNLSQNYPLTSRSRSKSIHALLPSKFRPLTSRAQLKHSIPMSPNQSARECNRYQSTSSPPSRVYQKQTPHKISNEVSYPYNQIQRNLFTKQQQILKQLQRQTFELEKQKQKVIQSNRQEYQIVVEKLMNMRRVCTERRHQIQSLKGELRALEQKNSYKKVKQFIQKKGQDKSGGHVDCNYSRGYTIYPSEGYVLHKKLAF